MYRNNKKGYTEFYRTIINATNAQPSKIRFQNAFARLCIRSAKLWSSQQGQISQQYRNLHTIFRAIIYREQSETLNKNGRFCNNIEIYTLFSKRLSVENKAKLSQIETQNTSTTVLFIYSSELTYMAFSEIFLRQFSVIPGNTVVWT